MVLAVGAVQYAFHAPTLTAISDEGLGMGYAAIALATLGFAVGLIFRLKVLLVVIAFLFVVSFAFSIARNFNFLDAALTIMAAQTLVQSGYFMGLLIRALFTAAHRTRPVL
jgi:hypothetical protein